MSKTLGFFRQWSMIPIAIALGILLLSAVMSGCAIDDYVQVRTPNTLVQDRGQPAKLSLTDARIEWSSGWKQEQASRVAMDESYRAWAERIEQSDLVADTLRSVTNLGIEAAATGAQSSGIPFGAPIVAGLLAIGTLYTRRPGDVSAKDAQTKADDSWDAARKELLETISSPAATPAT